MATRTPSLAPGLTAGSRLVPLCVTASFSRRLGGPPAGGGAGSGAGLAGEQAAPGLGLRGKGRRGGTGPAEPGDERVGAGAAVAPLPRFKGQRESLSCSLGLDLGYIYTLLQE